MDHMRVKLDTVMERLLSGHEHNLTLQANIATGQDHAGADALVPTSCMLLCDAVYVSCVADAPFSSG